MPAPVAGSDSAGFAPAFARELSHAEMASLRQRGGEYLYLAVAAGIGAICCLLAPLAAIWLTRAFAFRIPILNTTSGFLGVAVAIFGTPACLLLARDCLSRRALLLRDAAEGWTLRMAGCVGGVSLWHQAVAQGIRHGLLDGHPRRAQWLEILPCSGLIWHANGARSQKWVTAPCTSVGALWDRPSDSPELEPPPVRPLNPEEREELRRYVRRLLVRPASSTGAIALFLTASLWSGAVAEHQLNYAAWLAIFVWSAVRLLQAALQARRIAGDLRCGAALRLETPSHAGARGFGAVNEVLPVSGLLWTRDGARAEWLPERRRRARRGRGTVARPAQSRAA